MATLSPLLKQATPVVSNPAAPFGGIKHSGIGREGGRVGIEEFLEYKYAAIPMVTE